MTGATRGVVVGLLLALLLGGWLVSWSGGSPGPAADAGQPTTAPQAAEASAPNAAQARELVRSLTSGTPETVASSLLLGPGEQPSAELVDGLRGSVLMLDLPSAIRNDDGSLWVPAYLRGPGGATRAWRVLLIRQDRRWLVAGSAEDRP